MRSRSALAVSLVGIVAAGSLAPALAAPKKPAPIKKTYTATAPVPDPTPISGETGGNCSPTLDQAKHEAPFAIPYAGTLKVDLDGFQGDWALAVLDAKGAKIADHDNDLGTAIDEPSTITIKLKKKTTVTIRACNFAGGPTATVTLLYTAK